MALDIKTHSVRPKRQTFSNLAARFGEDRPASRYEEATYDLQAEANFHYMPTWDTRYELYDKRRTRIEMEDWNVLLDPRQYYYGAYTIARSKLMDSAEANLSFVEKGGMLQQLPEAVATQAALYLVPLRHYCWGANMNNYQIARMGYGAAVTQAATFAAMDDLAMAQILSRIGLMMDGMTGDCLEEGREVWLGHEAWQGLRHALEDSFVLEDWSEQLIAQNMILDSLVYPLWFGAFDRYWSRQGGMAISLSTEFMRRWYTEHQRWIDAVLSRMASESPENAELLSAWAGAWIRRGVEALTPLAEAVLGAGEGRTALEGAGAELGGRLSKAGIALSVGECRE